MKIVSNLLIFFQYILNSKVIPQLYIFNFYVTLNIDKFRGIDYNIL
jgi:hypothetical protein